MRKFALGVTVLAGIIASGFAVAPADAAVVNPGSAVGETQSKVGSDVMPVHCRRYWHCHDWGCHTCGAGPGYRPYGYRPYGYYRPYYHPYRYRYRY